MLTVFAVQSPRAEAVLSGAQGGGYLSELPPLCPPPNETGCKVAGLHNSCAHSVASRSWWKLCLRVFQQESRAVAGNPRDAAV